MQVVTRSQKKFVSETITKDKSKSNVKEVCLPSWFMKTIQTYLDKINTSNDHQDKARLVMEMFYIINQHFDEVFKSFDDYKRQFAIIKLGETLYTKAEELSIALALVNISKVPLKLRQLALDELKQAKQTLYPYIVNPYVVNISLCGKSQLVLREFEAENKAYDIYEEEVDEEEQEKIDAEEKARIKEEEDAKMKQEGLRRKKLSALRRKKLEAMRLKELKAKK